MLHDLFNRNNAAPQWVESTQWYGNPYNVCAYEPVESSLPPPEHRLCLLDIPTTLFIKHTNAATIQSVRKLVPASESSFRNVPGANSLSRSSRIQSKECQTAAWQDHKHFCRLNSRPPVSSNQQEALKRLHAFCAKHKPSLSAAAIVALELCRDRTRPLRDCVHICVTEVPNATCPEQSFKALSAEIVPFEFFGPEEGEEFRSQIRDSASYSQRIGHAGCFMVIVSELGRFNISTNIIEHFREEEIPASTTGVSWERLINLLNSGTVV